MIDGLLPYFVTNFSSFAVLQLVILPRLLAPDLIVVVFTAVCCRDIMLTGGGSVLNTTAGRFYLLLFTVSACEQLCKRTRDNTSVWSDIVRNLFV